MDREKKKTIALAVLLSLAVITAIVYFFWGNFINRGTLRVVVEPPFTVEIFDNAIIRDSTLCETSPCLIKQKSGLSDLLIKKDGYKSLLTEVDIKLWRTVEIYPQLLLIPHIEETDSLPQVKENTQYVLVTDEEVGMQKLVKKDDKNSNAIVYFKPPLKDSTIIGDKNFAMIIEQTLQNPSAYIIDIANSKRTFLSDEELENINDGLWSNDGKYLVFSKTDSPYLWTFERETGLITQTLLQVSLTHVSWALEHDLIFVTDQTYQTSNDDTFKPLTEKSLKDITFGIYKAKNQSYTYIGSFGEIGRLPDKFIPLTNAQAIYFSLDEKNFRIFLRKF